MWVNVRGGEVWGFSCDIAMNRNVQTKLNDFAARLLDYEARASSSSPPTSSSSDAANITPVCEKLRQALSQLTGVGGFRSLLSRALALAGAEVPWLRGVIIKADGSLEGVEALQAKLAREEISLGEVTLVARLLGLLVTFIGPALTQRLVQDIWPEMEHLNLEMENGDEKS